MKLGLPKYLQKFLMKMGILMLIFSLCRITFFIRNADYFPDVGVNEFIVGIWFDLITTCLLFFPLIAIELFPNKNRNKIWFKWMVAGITAFIFFSSIFINLVDIEYFAFTSARSTKSLFIMLSFGSDLKDQIPSFIRDFWYIGLLIAVLFAGSLLLLKRIYRSADDSAKVPLWKQTVVLVIVSAGAVFIGRGGFVHKPIRPTEASKYTEPANVQFVLNTAYTVIQSWSTASIELKVYMPKKEALTLFNPIHNYAGNAKINGHNICIIIIESFSIEFINSLNGTDDEKSWTPFFDSLVDSSLICTWGFANGKKSIDAVPSIISSVPKFMSDEYMLSAYSTNKIESLPEKLEELGYSTAFYHGATNGSMNFDAYCSLAGFDSYYGRSEYGNDDDFDGTWGIWDEEFLGWTVDKISRMKTPFFSTIFTISSHPPYELPDQYEKMFGDAKTDQHKVVQYTDQALQKFFEKAKKQPWFDNTLFILTADHTPSSSRSIYLHDRGKMHIPLLFYHPLDTFFRGEEKRVAGHIDIMPTILDLVGYEKDFFSFGHSIFDSIPGYTFSEVADKKMLFEGIEDDAHVLIYQKEKVVALYNLLDKQQRQNLIDSEEVHTAHYQKRLRAIIQLYNHCLIYNQMTVDRFTY